jgi:hypothetical protein
VSQVGMIIPYWGFQGVAVLSVSNTCAVTGALQLAFSTPRRATGCFRGGP